MRAVDSLYIETDFRGIGFGAPRWNTNDPAVSGEFHEPALKSRRKLQRQMSEGDLWRCGCGKIYYEVTVEEALTYSDPKALLTCRRCRANCLTFVPATHNELRSDSCRRACERVGLPCFAWPQGR